MYSTTSFSWSTISAENAFEVKAGRFETNDYLTIGDYGGAGSIGQANFKTLKKHFSNEEIFEVPMSELNMLNEIPEGTKVVILWGGYSSETAFLLESDRKAYDMLCGLESYPVLSDEDWDEIESEWEWYAMDSYFQHSFSRSIVKWDKEERGPSFGENLEELLSKFDAEDMLNTLYEISHQEQQYIEVTHDGNTASDSYFDDEYEGNRDLLKKLVWALFTRRHE